MSLALGAYRESWTQMGSLAQGIFHEGSPSSNSRSGLRRSWSISELCCLLLKDQHARANGAPLPRAASPAPAWALERIALGFSGGGTAHHCGVSHDPIMIQYARRPKRTKLQLEALALGVVAHGAVSVTV